jgi:UDP-N-acetylmuramoyl-L-alanyl-D-glutamate--2,6-diaminopimelate ligase
MTSPRGIRLHALARALALPVHGEGDPHVTGITEDSRRVRPGDLFVAYNGHSTDGARFVPAALAAGAVAVCAERPVPGVPTLVTATPRAALPLLAAEVYGHPARELRLIGITGSLGKTSTSLIVEACLAAAHQRVGIIGSLGVRARGHAVDTRMTTPGAPVIHESLRWMADEGVAAVLMEVTSHAIALDRVTGLEFALGVFTNLVPDEHLEFHPTPEAYVQTKLRFLDMLRPGAPVVFGWDDDTVRAAVMRWTRGPAIGVSLSGDPHAPVRVIERRAHVAGSHFRLVVDAPLPTIHGAPLQSATLDLSLPLLGREQVGNAALAVTAALVAGASTEDVVRGLATIAPIRRRMEIVHAPAPLVVDDSVGHPRSIAQVADLVRALPGRRVRVVYAIRGARGPGINARNAAALGALVAECGATLVVTASDDVADARNRVHDEERRAVEDTLRRDGVPYHYEHTLQAAVHAALRDAEANDLVLLLGAQGMDEGARFAREALGR